MWAIWLYWQDILVNGTDLKGCKITFETSRLQQGHGASKEAHVMTMRCQQIYIYRKVYWRHLWWQMDGETCYLHPCYDVILVLHVNINCNALKSVTHSLLLPMFLERKRCVFSLKWCILGALCMKLMNMYGLYIYFIIEPQSCVIKVLHCD